MANGHGGKRTPANPAPVSGPGALSRRTDGGPAQVLRDLPNAGYGENAEFQQLQQSAALSNTLNETQATQPPPGGGMGLPDASSLTPLNAPTQRPQEPITAGAPIGDGPGPASEVVGASNRLSDLLERMMGHDLSGDIADLYNNARARGL